MDKINHERYNIIEISTERSEPCLIPVVVKNTRNAADEEKKRGRLI